MLMGHYNSITRDRQSTKFAALPGQKCQEDRHFCPHPVDCRAKISALLGFVVLQHPFEISADIPIDANLSREFHKNQHLQ
jgi:hypothetical protein